MQLHSSKPSRGLQLLLPAKAMGITWQLEFWVIRHCGKSLLLSIQDQPSVTTGTERLISKSHICIDVYCQISIIRRRPVTYKVMLEGYPNMPASFLFRNFSNEMSKLVFKRLEHNHMLFWRLRIVWLLPRRKVKQLIFSLTFQCACSTFWHSRYLIFAQVKKKTALPMFVSLHLA